MESIGNDSRQSTIVQDNHRVGILCQSPHGKQAVVGVDNHIC